MSLRFLILINFNPRSPCGERLAICHAGTYITDFNPRSPCGERREKWDSTLRFIQFQSTLPVWGATTTARRSSLIPTISIHAPRVGSDKIPSPSIRVPSMISIHAPRVGSDICCGIRQFVITDFNPRSPCGERLWSRKVLSKTNGFQSTLPVWGATQIKPRARNGSAISIHAPRVGSDSDVPWPSHEWRYFNPRSPCGERQQRYTNFKVHLWQQGRIFASLREERRNSHQAAALRDRFFDGNLGANLPAFSVYYGFAVRESRCPPAYSCSCSQNAPPSFRTGCPGNKTVASPFLRP